MAKRQQQKAEENEARFLSIRRGLILATVFSALLAVLLWAGIQLEHFLIRDPQFTLATPPDPGEDSPAVEVIGVKHTARERVSDTFEKDYGRSIYLMPLRQRRDDLLRLQWVKDARVTRVWPNRLQIRITEREPVAFVQLPGEVELPLIDADGHLLRPETKQTLNLPILTGINRQQNDEERRVRVRRLQKLVADAGELAAVETLVRLGPQGLQRVHGGPVRLDVEHPPTRGGDRGAGGDGHAVPDRSAGERQPVVRGCAGGRAVQPEPGRVRLVSDDRVLGQECADRSGERFTGECADRALRAGPPDPGCLDAGRVDRVEQSGDRRPDVVTRLDERGHPAGRGHEVAGLARVGEERRRGFRADRDEVLEAVELHLGELGEVRHPFEPGEAGAPPHPGRERLAEDLRAGRGAEPRHVGEQVGVTGDVVADDEGGRCPAAQRCDRLGEAVGVRGAGDDGRGRCRHHAAAATGLSAPTGLSGAADLRQRLHQVRRLAAPARLTHSARQMAALAAGFRVGKEAHGSAGGCEGGGNGGHRPRADVRHAAGGSGCDGAAHRPPGTGGTGLQA